MKKITSFLSLVMLCCISVFAQDYVGTEIPANKLVKIGTMQTELVPGQWYFIHTPRNANQSAVDFAVDGQIQSAGGLVYEKNDGSVAGVSATSVIDEATSEEGVSANDMLKYMIRFHAVEDLQDVYTIEYANGKWMGANLGSVSKNEAIAGQAGKFNFYLVENISDGTPNTAGRFAWNEYDMARRVDNNGAGNTLSYWAEGKTTAEDMGADNEDIKGNKIWQIYNIEIVGDLDVWEEAFQALIDANATISAYQDGDALRVDNWAAGVGVGTEPGNYKKEYIDAFLAIHNQINDLMYLAEDEGVEAVQAQYTAAQLDELTLAYNNAYVQAVQNKVPRAMTTIEPGYYFIQSMLNWYETVQDTTFYTEEEANEANAESGAVEGDEDYLVAGDVKEVTSRQVDAPIKGLKSHDSAGEGWVAWMNLEKKAEWLWKIEREEADSTGTKYYLINAYRNHYFTGITQSSNSKLVFTPATVCFDYRGEGVAPVTGDSVTVINIRASQHAEGGYNYIHCGGHSSGAGKSGWAVGWTDAGATQWTLLPVSDVEVEQILNGPEAQVKKMVAKGDSIANAFPAQLTIAKDKVADVNWDVPVANADNFDSPFTCTSEGSIAQLFDGVTNELYNHWHSEWNSGSENAYSMTNGTNYFVINDTEALINGGLAVEIGRRGAANDHVAELTVYGTNDDYDVASATEALKADANTANDGFTWTKLGVLSTPFASTSEVVVSNAIEFEGQYKYYKFVATHTVGSNYSDRGYFHMGEFQLYPATISKRYETVQYDVRQAEADAAAAAVDAWVAAGFSADSVELFTDETFNATYNALLAAYNAWDAVYVNPGALRTSLFNAPDDELFVVGNNPGQWAEGVATPATVVAAAKAYDATGKYTDAESEAHIKAIADILAVVYDQANPVEEGKWYRIKFASEEMFDQYGWAKVAGAPVVSHEITTSTGLFGKTVAAGNSVKAYESYENEDGTAGEVTVYAVEEAEEFFEGQKLMFFEDELSNGEDLFRFIAVSDSTFMIQNKATGLYIRATHPAVLSATPSVFQQFAIGAGGNVLRAYNVNGGEDNGYNYLHGQVADMALVSWDEASLGSRSMFLIEEVEAVSDVPSNNYVQKLWPGQLNAYALPVDITVGEGATAYGAQLNVTEEDTTVVLMAIEAEVIKGGTPFILVADSEEEYVSYADRLAEIKANLKEDLGDDYTSNDDLAAEAIVNSEFYAQVEMTHGETLAHEVDTLGNLVGTFKNTSIAAGKAIQTKENGFVHTLVDGSIAAYKAWVKADFDANTGDVLKGIEVKIEGSIDTGISEALDKVAKGGDIYTVGGQLVGKGNVNTVNNLPAGIYVVNGVKVIKK